MAVAEEHRLVKPARLQPLPHLELLSHLPIETAHNFVNACIYGVLDQGRSTSAPVQHLVQTYLLKPPGNMSMIVLPGSQRKLHNQAVHA